MTDPFDLERFVRAQEDSGTYEQALAELRAGRKRSHWMWFVLPQVAGLGHSATAQRYAVSGLDEARALLAHPVLGPRLIECARALEQLDEHDPRKVLGDIDAVKLRSSMTLFERAAADAADAHPDSESSSDADVHRAAAELFGRVLDHYFDGRRDDATLAIVGRPS
ncbi:DUF1810 domain-containing protein [Humibacillus xanthopallidus]|uniref:Uncharacterized protein (DUF1810 family) n=1 Tax=Humibacillus xanthopallidus TaxID=412689 RepID=A0A543HX41_9MICO|nr:DUF1810 domain-containing protein [Humibacillus xanthopallidus]TQM62934.1 uncharacterized protein (DUF1810 family) [Humibacillus xanthopallidus]